MTRDYPRLDIVPFGEQLLISGDLDPVYIALHKMELPEDQLHRWLIAYWCLYHCGAACYLSEATGQAFWMRLFDAARNETPAPTGGRWPRGHERRHFRGEQGKEAVRQLNDRYPLKPQQMVHYVAGFHEERTVQRYEAVAGRAQEHRGFGPWMAFKIADMVDRVLGVPVDFTEGAVFMFKDPAKAAEMVWERYVGPVERSKMDLLERRHRVVTMLTERLSTHTAPPLHDRRVNIQEVETVLCKWKSHVRGHYPLFNDIDEIRAGLAQWLPTCATAAAMLHHMPKGSENVHIHTSHRSQGGPWESSQKGSA